MTYETLLWEQDGPVLTLTLNRPDKLNAYTATMGLEIEDAFVRADEDDSVRVIIVTGAGRAFCAGADISSGAGAFDSKAEGSVAFGDAGTTARRRSGGGFIGAIFNCRKPIIAALNGAAVGVGATLTLPMDIRIAAKGARVGFVFARRGLVPEAGSAWFLPRLVGLPTALRWCLSGALIPAEEAKAGGLVSEVVEPEALMDRARAELDRRAVIAVILSRFPLSALGPWINLASGATRLAWHRCTLGVLVGDRQTLGSGVLRMAGTGGTLRSSELRLLVGPVPR